MADQNLLLCAIPMGMLLWTLIVSWYTYPCDAYGFVQWNENDKSEIRPAYLPRFLDPYNAKCTENCDRYRELIEQLGGTGLRELNTPATPNPFCFDWDSEYNKTEGNAKHQKLVTKQQRSMDGNWRNKMSILLTVTTILFLSTQKTMIKDIASTDIWFSICLFITLSCHIGTLYFGSTAASYLHCQHRTAHHDSVTGCFQDFSYGFSCGAQMTIHKGYLNNGLEVLKDALPEIPKHWVLYKWNLGLNFLATIPILVAGMDNIWLWRRECRLRLYERQR